MRGVIDIYVSAWSGVGSLNLLVASSIIATVEGSMDRLFSNYLILNVVLLLFNVVETGPRIFRESLPSIRCFTLMLPKFTSICPCKE